MGYHTYESYPLLFMSGSSNMADSTPYFLGFNATTLSTSGTSGTRQLVIRSGTIRNITVQVFNATVNASNEAVAWVLRKNDTTDYPLSTTETMETGTKVFTGLQIPISKDDFVFIKITTPAWVTNPEGTYLYATAEVQC